MKKQIIIALIFSQALLSSCSHTLTAIDENYLGNRYYYASEYENALAKYQAALNLAEKDGDKQYEAIAMYGIARGNAQLCKTSEAEKWFKRSILTRRELPNLNEAYLTQNLLEYARFLHSLSREKEAVALYDEAIPALEKLGTEGRDPLGYVNLYHFS